MSILPIFIPHAGCPHQCVFCNQRTISGQKTAAISEAQQQIERWLPRLRPGADNEAAFYGGSFTGLDIALQEKLLALTDALIKQKIIGSVRLSTRPDYINKEVLALLQQHNVKLVELGVQSLDDAVLAIAGRGQTSAQVYDAVALLKKSGFKTGLQLMTGLPAQSFASVKDTACRAAALAPDTARIYPLLVLKGTPLAEIYAAGDYAPLSLEEAVEQCAYVYRVLTQAGVKVIRIGLQADAELCAPGNIIAGPFHAALGELVKSRVLRDRLTPEIKKLAAQGASALLLQCSLKKESQLRGNKNANLKFWQQQFPLLQFNIRHDLENTEEVSVCAANHSHL